METIDLDKSLSLVTTLTGIEKEKYNIMIEHITLKLQKPFNAARIMNLIGSAVKYISGINRSGLEKKELVLHGVKSVIFNTDKILDEERQTLLDLVDLVGDATIDNIVSFGTDRNTFTKPGLLSLFKKKEKHLLEPPTEVIEHLSQYLSFDMQRPFTVAKVLTLIAHGVKFVEQDSHNLHGVVKKDLVISTLRNIITTTDKLSDESRKELLDLLDLVGSEYIDVLVEFGYDMKTFALNCLKGCL